MVNDKIRNENVDEANGAVAVTNTTSKIYLQSLLGPKENSFG